MFLTANKVDYIFEEPLNLHIPYNCCLENRAKLKKLFNLNSRLRWGAQQPRYTEYTYYFLISNCSNARDFLKQKLI